MKLFGSSLSFKTHVDVVKLNVGEDHVAPEPCWFCGGTVTILPGTGNPGLVILTIDPFGADEGERVHTVCHADCASRAQGVLRA